ncbi:molybdopterin synthase sulfur carrier subunit [Longispora fulva]|uniref:Molybdopterin converting factor small subunit n=1 Tax=Longispora fulva TaxID=619741 RepID=A0A8J7GVH5_9ACTN|nr:MoaD/ThiS family protein [Longispora fulva]MBG6139063.1 molybdopterin converting factor small subunit [Longispora fulva]GIG58556.1 molybdopterin synthase sulfur carrier subunit [Longispora fulva]
MTILLPGVLRADAGGASRLAGEPGELRAVLDALGREFPLLERRVRDEQGAIRRYVNVYVNGEPAGLETPVPDGAEVQVLPSVAGG